MSQQRDLRLLRQGPRQNDASLSAAREFGDEVVVQCLESGLCQHLLDGLMVMGRGRQEPAAVQRATEGYCLLDGEGRRYPLTLWRQG